MFEKLANEIFSPVDAGGANRRVLNSDTQKWGTAVERALVAFQAGGGVIFPDLATANASLTYPQNTMAWVLGSGAGVYRKVGTSGSGSWVRMADLPYSFIVATNAGAGSANAIQATTPIPVPSVDGGALIALNITATNTASPVTVSFNGGAPLTIKTSSGNNPAIGGLVAGMTVAGYKVGSDFRMLSDQASASIVADAEAAQAAAEAARDATIAALDSVSVSIFPSKSSVQAYSPAVAPTFVETAFFDADRVSGSGSQYALSGTSDPSAPGQVSITTSPGGVTNFYVPSNKIIKPQRHGAKTGGNATTNRGAILEMLALANRTGNVIDMGGANDIYDVSDTIDFTWTKKPVIRGDGAQIKLSTGGAHKDYAVRFLMDKLGFDIEGLRVDANLQAANALFIENLDTATTYVEANVHDAIAVDIEGSRAYRKNSTDYLGSGITIKGWFRELVMRRPVMREARMASGAGVPSATGIIGVYITRSSTGGYPMFKTLVDPVIGKVWCEDLSYLVDMDGLAIFDPIPAGNLSRVVGTTTIRGGQFSNHAGRSIKLQTQNNDLSGINYRLDTAPTGNKTICLVDFQFGEGNHRGGTLFAQGNIPQNLFVGTGRDFANGQMLVDGFNVNGRGAVPEFESVAFKYADPSHLRGTLTVRDCGVQFVLPKYIARYTERVNPRNRAVVEDNSLWAMASGAAGVRLEGGGSNSVSAIFKGNSQAGSSGASISSTSAATAAVTGGEADNYGFTA